MNRGPDNKSSGASEPTVSLSQIAELAGVGASAVSNWRKRFDDFPSPVAAAAGGRDVFSLPAIVAWLNANDRLDPDRQAERILFTAADLIRGEASSDQIIEVLCAAIALVHLTNREGIASGAGHARASELIAGVENHAPDLTNLFEPLERIDPTRVDQVIQLVRELSAAERPQMFEWLLARKRRFSEARTSEQLVDLLVGMALDGGRTVFDPAAGEGGFLLAFARAVDSPVELSGQERNLSTWRLARQRFLLHDIPVHLRPGDSLLADAFPDVRADVVLCDPPYGAEARLPDAAMTDPRWLFGFPTRNADYAWLQHVIYHLADEGRGYVFLPAGTLFRRGREAEIRSELIRSGAVEAVVALPGGAARHTAVPLALWVVRRPFTNQVPNTVLLIDAAAVAPDSKQLTHETRDRVSEVVRRWRSQEELDEQDGSIAVAVPLIDLLGSDIDLTPARWIVDDSTPATSELIETIVSATELLSGLTREAGEMTLDVSGIVPDQHVPWVSVRGLIDRGAAELVRGVRVRAEECLEEGVRTLRTRDIGERSILEDNEPCFIDPSERRGRAVLTEVGDIVVSPGGGNLRAVVDERGGHLLVRPLEGIRLRGDWLDPHVIAAFLTSDRNHRFLTGTTAGWARVDVRNLEIPLLPPTQAQRLHELMGQTESAEAVGRTVLEFTEVLRAAMLRLAVSEPETSS